MSFILDALKKSETDRQQKGAAEFAGVPTSSGRREGPPAWMWVVGILLIVNLAVLIGIWLRPDVTPDVQAAAPRAVAVPATDPEASAEDAFEEQVAAARQNAPQREVEQVIEAPRPEPHSPGVTVASEPINNIAALPTAQEVVVSGVLTFPDLHVDIHVYSESREDRFVFINMVKHNEGSRLAEGPLVEEITPDGVVLSMSGTTFLLPRD